MPEWRLFVITGFLGGLTTFSTFSAEVTELLQQGKLLWAGAAISAHVVGSLAMTLLGLATVAAVRGAPDQALAPPQPSHWAAKRSDSTCSVTWWIWKRSCSSRVARTSSAS